MTETITKSALIARLQETFCLRFNTSSTQAKTKIQLAFAPGRINLIGEHTDYNDGFVFPMALELGVGLCFRRRNDDQVRLFAMHQEEWGEFSLAEIKRTEKQPWLNYPMGVARMLQAQGLDLGGIEGVIDGNLPVGAGLSSSAALEVACALALLSTVEISLPPQEVARLCRRAENEFVGLNCGIMDQFIAVLAKQGTALFLDTRTLDFEHIALPSPNKYIFVICDSGVKHSLAASQYNVRHSECKHAAMILANKIPDVKALRDVSIVEFEKYREYLPLPIRKRAEHVVYENDRTLKASEALKCHDTTTFGELMNASHESLRKLFEVSCQELDLLVELARQVPGAIGSRMTGGGFGGCTISLVETAGLERFQMDVAKGYKAAIGRECRIFISEAGGAAEIYKVTSGDNNNK